MTLMLKVISQVPLVLIRQLYRIRSINDPDKGYWQTDYNALGETIRTIAPDGITTLNYLDSVGREQLTE